MSESVYNKVSFATFKYLQGNLDTSFYANDFSKTHFLALQKYLFSLFSKDSTLSNTLAIEKGFRDHFAKSHQEIKIDLSDTNITLRKLIKNSNINVDMDRAIFILDQELDELFIHKQDYGLSSYLYRFPKQKVSNLKNGFSKLNIKAEEIRSLLRQKTELIFELKKRDIVLFFSHQMYIRLFIKPKVQAKGSNQRFNACDPKKLDEVYKKRFNEDFSLKLIEMIPELESSSLNFSRLDNANFHIKVPDTFRSFIDIAMIDNTQGLDEETALALNGYVLRKHFDIILEKLADILMKKVLQRDKKADEFLKYYNGETVLNKKGKKIKKNFITDSQNNIWNYSAIFSTLTQHTQSDKKILSQKRILSQKKATFEEIEKVHLQMKEVHDMEVAKLDSFREELVEDTLKHNDLKQRYDSTKDSTLQAQFRSSHDSLNLKERSYNTKKEALDSSNISFENHQIETNNRKMQYTKEEETMQSIEKSFEELNDNYKLIKAALAKAITGR